MSNPNPNSNESILALAIKNGLNLIRCQMTGIVIGEINDSALLASIQLEKYNKPFASAEHIFDSMFIRACIFNTRTAPHMSLHRSKDTLKFLAAHYPQDLFALLTGTLLFDNMHTKWESSSATRFDKIAWLIKLQDSINDESITANLPDMLKSLLFIDSVINLKKVYLVESTIKEAKRIVHLESFSADALIAFIARVEKEALDFLARSKATLAGNSMALSAAIMVMSDDELSVYEMRQTESENARKERIMRYLADTKPNNRAGKTQSRRVPLDKVASILIEGKAGKYAALAAKDNKPKKAKVSRFGDLSAFDFSDF